MLESLLLIFGVWELELQYKALWYIALCGLHTRKVLVMKASCTSAFCGYDYVQPSSANLNYRSTRQISVSRTVDLIVLQCDK